MQVAARVIHLLYIYIFLKICCARTYGELNSDDLYGCFPNLMGQSVTSSDTEAQIMAAHPTPISKMTQDSAFPHLIATICQVDLIHFYSYF